MKTGILAEAAGEGSEDPETVRTRRNRSTVHPRPRGRPGRSGHLRSRQARRQPMTGGPNVNSLEGRTAVVTGDCVRRRAGRRRLLVGLTVR